MSRDEHIQRSARELRQLMSLPDDRISLARAALLIASCEYPWLDSSRYLQRLDEMANAVSKTVAGATDPLRVIAGINQQLFEREGFRGNAEDYYDPRNSYLNDVIDRKTGIPIMLSTVYLEVAERLKFPLVGVGMPGHYLVKHPYFGIFIDPFAGGEIVNEQQCRERMTRALGDSVPFHRSYLEGVSKLHTVTRMLNNLRSVYHNNRQFAKALQITELVLALHPDSLDDLKQKAALLLEERRYAQAFAAVTEYIERAPDDEQIDDLRQTAVRLRKALAQMN